MKIDVVTDDRLTDTVGDGFDLGIRLGERLEQDMIARPLSGPLAMRVVASPAYFKQFGHPKHPKDLSSHRCLSYRWPTSGRVYEWEFNDGCSSIEVDVPACLIVNEPQMLLPIAVAGLGIAYVFEPLARDYLRSGELVETLSDWTPNFPGFYVYYANRHASAPAIDALLNYL